MAQLGAQRVVQRVRVRRALEVAGIVRSVWRESDVLSPFCRVPSEHCGPSPFLLLMLLFLFYVACQVKVSPIIGTTCHIVPRLKSTYPVLAQAPWYLQLRCLRLSWLGGGMFALLAMERLQSSVRRARASVLMKWDDAKHYVM